MSKIQIKTENELGNIKSLTAGVSELDCYIIMNQKVFEENFKN